jgi:hypothetical protein
MVFTALRRTRSISRKPPSEALLRGKRRVQKVLENTLRNHAEPPIKGVTFRERNGRKQNQRKNKEVIWQL